MLIDPSLMTEVSDQKIAAYDLLVELLQDLKAEAPNASIAETIENLSRLDAEILRPKDTLVLELLFTDQAAAQILYFKEYEPRRREYEAMLRSVADSMTEVAKNEQRNFHEQNKRSIWSILGALFFGVAVVLFVNFASQRLERKGTNSQKLLGVLSEGMFFFDKKGSIALERSQALNKIIPEHVKYENAGDFFAEYGRVSKAALNTVIDLLWPKEDDGRFSPCVQSRIKLSPGSSSAKACLPSKSLRIVAERQAMRLV